MSDISSTVWSLEPHTRAKHEILENYLKAWFPILSRYSGRIIYLDGFAGPGVYSGGEPGSPVIALRTAVEHSLRHRFNQIRFIFIEKKADRATSLQKVLKAEFPHLPDNIKYSVIGAEFAPTLEGVLREIERIGANLAPTFAFLDPFGFSGFPMELISRMMSYDKCEVLITFMERDINRFADEKRESVLNELYATEVWKKVREIADPEQRRRFLIDLYESQLKQLGGATYARSFEMIGADNQPIYYLIFGTKHPKGLEVMKNAMWKVDRRGTYKFSDLTDLNQRYLIDYTNESHWIPKAAAMVYNQFKRKTITGSDAQHYVVTETPYIYKAEILRFLELSKPPKISVTNRVRRLCYPETCLITFV